MANRVFLGALGDGNYGLIVSKPGVAVSATNLGNLLFDSRAQWARALVRGQISMSLNQASVSVNVGQSLNFAPIVHLIQEYNAGSNTYWRPDSNLWWTHSGSTVTFSRSITTYATKLAYAVFTSRADA